MAKGRRIEWPSRDGVENLEESATEFILKIFGLETSEYLIADESHPSDFLEITENDMRETVRRRAAKEPVPRAKSWDPEPFRTKIHQHYGEEIAAFESGNLLDIFRRIWAERKKHKARLMSTKARFLHDKTTHACQNGIAAGINRQKKTK